MFCEYFRKKACSSTPEMDIYLTIPPSFEESLLNPAMLLKKPGSVKEATLRTELLSQILQQRWSITKCHFCCGVSIRWGQDTAQNYMTFGNIWSMLKNLTKKVANRTWVFTLPQIVGSKYANMALRFPPITWHVCTNVINNSRGYSPPTFRIEDGTWIPRLITQPFPELGWQMMSLTAVRGGPHLEVN